jgi:Raf kinase inhibitor-like YbhB/YbcL family protein
VKHTGFALFALLALLAATNARSESAEGELTMTLTSPAFAHGEAIPRQYTCDGSDTSPALTWSGAPAGTQSFALICDDPDAPAGIWVHWVLYDIPVSVTSLEEGIASVNHPDSGGTHGTTSFRRLGYGGPCPPGGTHRYYFKLYALDTILDLSPGATKRQLVQAMEGHILAEAQLMGTYTR